MNQQDKEAFDAWFPKPEPLKSHRVLEIDALIIWQAACEYKDKQNATKRPVDPADDSYPNAEEVARTLHNCREDLIIEADFVLWQDKQLAAKDAGIEKLRKALRQIFGLTTDPVLDTIAKEALAIPNDDSALQEALKQARKDALLEAAYSLRIESDTLGWHENHCKKWLRRMADKQQD